MRQSTENFTFFYVDLWTMDPEVDSRPALCARTQRTTWFDSGYKCVSLLRISRFSTWICGLRILRSILVLLFVPVYSALLGSTVDTNASVY